MNIDIRITIDSHFFNRVAAAILILSLHVRGFL